MNTATRYRCLEVPINDDEHERITATAKLFGMPRAVFARFTMSQFMTNDAPPDAPTESRCGRDAPIASRPSAGLKSPSGGGVKFPGKRGAGRPRIVRLL